MLFTLFWVNTPLFAKEKYKTVRTQGFAYHYPEYLQEQASEIANTTEQIAYKLSQKYGVDLSKPVDIRVSNALYSNGQAISLLNRMRLWVTDWDIRLRTTHPWQADVATHEFAHLATLDLAAKTSTHLFGIQAMYQSYYNDATQARMQWLLPLSFHTAWLAEGISQYESEQFGFDDWDTHRDMVVRVAHANQSLLNFSKMDNFNSEKEIELETGPYTQGYSLVRFIAHNWGDSALVNIWKAHSKWSTWSLDQCLEDVIQVDGDSLFVLWRQHLDSVYSKQKEILGEIVEGEKLTYNSFNNHHLRVKGDSLWWLGNLASSSWKENVLVSHDSLFQADSTKWSERDDIKYKQSWEKTWLSRGWDLNEKGQFLRTSYAHRDSNDYARLDIFLNDSNSSRHLTIGEDAFYPRFAEGGDIYYLRRPPNGTDFELVRLSAITDTMISQIQEIPLYNQSKKQIRILKEFNSHKTVLFSKSIYQKSRQIEKLSQFNIYSLDVSPKGKVAISFYDGKNRQLAIIDDFKSDSSKAKVLTNSSVNSEKDDTLQTYSKNIQYLSIEQTDLRDPHWGPDDKLYFSWNLNGIFNIYQFDFKTSQFQPLTNVLGGAFNPVLLKDKIYYSGYDKDGFSLYKINLNELQSKAVPAELASVKRWKTKGIPLDDHEREFAGLAKEYNSLAWNWFMSPMILLENKVSDGQNLSSSRDLSVKLGAAVQWQDPLEWHQLQISFLTEVDQGVPFLDHQVQSDLFARYDSKRFVLPWYVEASSRSIQIQSNYLSEDNVKINTESGISLSNLNLGFGKSLFYQGDTLHAYVGAEGGRQEIPNVPSWWFEQAQYVGIELGYSKGIQNGPQMTPGFQVKLLNEFRQTDLQDSVYQEKQYSMTVDYKNWLTTKTSADLLYVTHVPNFGLLKNPWSLGLKGHLTHIEKIHSNSYTDSLDSWLQPALWLDGYPFLTEFDSKNPTDGQEVLFKGDNKVLFEAYLQHNLWESEYSWRGFHHRGAWLSWVAQWGQVWDGSLFDETIWGEWNYQRSVGVEFRTSQKIFHSMPLEMYVKISRAIDQASNAGDLSQRIGYLSLIPEKIRPTTLYYGITFSFQNPLVYSQPTFDSE